MNTVEQLIREAAGLNAKALEKAASLPLDKTEAKKISTGLMKVAELPYSEGVYSSVKEMMKIAATSIDSLVNELDEKTYRLNQLTKIASVREVVDQLLDRGLLEKNDIQEKSAELLKKSDKEMEIVKEAIALGTGSSKNIFFESEKIASSISVKRGIFDGVEGL